MSSKPKPASKPLPPAIARDAKRLAELARPAVRNAAAKPKPSKGK